MFIDVVAQFIGLLRLINQATTKNHLKESYLGVLLN
jgi:hypothetical protein